MSFSKPNGTLEDIAADIGYTATTLLVDWFGGGSLYVPATDENKEHPICRVIGERPFARLVAEYGSQTIDLPLDYRREVTRRNRLIGALVLRGESVRSIARAALMSERQVANIRNELEAAGLIPYILRAGVTISMAYEVVPETTAPAPPRTLPLPFE